MVEEGTDTLDVRILRLLLQGQVPSPLSPDFRQSLAAIAKKVRVDEDTIRHRLRKMEASGFIEGWRLLVNPTVWGGGQISVLFDVDPESSKRELVEKLRLVPGIIFVTAFYDSMGAFLEYVDEIVVPREIELIRQLSGATDVFVAKTAFPECNAVLTARDWSLLRALRENPRKSYGELALEVGLCARTVRSRVSRLLAQSIAFAWPALNMRAARGGVLIHLIVWYPGERKAEIDRTLTAELEPYLWHTMHMLPYRHGDLWPCGYDLFVPNMSIAREVLGSVKRVPGVEQARVLVHEDIFNFFDAVDEEFDRMLSRMPAAMPNARVETKSKPPSALRPA